MLGLRLKAGIELSSLSPVANEEAKLAALQGLLDEEQIENGRAVLTNKGRLLADGLVSRLWS
jgi:oxygen-independent coproporphyrinogen-3 oxidase